MGEIVVALQRTSVLTILAAGGILFIHLSAVTDIRAHSSPTNI
jgi:hypothetical protein